MRKLSLWVLDLICGGLGLESRYLRDELSQVQLMAINHGKLLDTPGVS